MAASDELAKLTARAKEAEQRAAAARDKAKAELEQDVESARISAQEQAEKLRQSADAGKDKISVWWHDLQRSWNEHLATIRDDIDRRRSEHDMDKAGLRADIAEDDALFAIDYAYAAIDEAEYAVLDATLARVEADELVAESSGARA
jgi:vacuolar-type H+-ATPase subunit I/STV1